MIPYDKLQYKPNEKNVQESFTPPHLPRFQNLLYETDYIKLMHCEKCKIKHEGKFASGRFCSRACANAREMSLKTKQKISSKLKDRTRKKKIYKDVERACKNCYNKFVISEKSTRKCCSKKCLKKNRGGFREGSGRSKSGWYKGIFCNSTWELAFLICCSDAGIKVERCNEKFEYLHKNTTKNYHPDFKIKETYIEIKGFEPESFKSKLEFFPKEKKLLIFRKENLNHIFDYVFKFYGKNFFELYEGNPHKLRNNFCKVCNEPAIKIYCSQRCSFFGNRKKTP